MPVITMSRQRGSMGSYIAVAAARTLDLQYLDREIIDSVAREAGVTTEQVEALEARAARLARLMHLLGARPRLPAVPSASLREQDQFEARVDALVESNGLSREAARSLLESTGGVEYAPRSDYLDVMAAVILEFAAQGRAMIVGRGGQMILRAHPGALHVQTIARFETRVYNITKREGVKWREAAHRVRLADEHRAGYMRRFYNVDWLDSSLYDLVLNTDKITADVAAETLVRTALAVEEATEEAE